MHRLRADVRMARDRPARRRRVSVGGVNALRVAFVDHVGATAGGAEHTLATLLKHLPREAIEPSIVLFEDGAFAQRLRTAGWDVAIVPLHQATPPPTPHPLPSPPLPPPPPH